MVENKNIKLTLNNSIELGESVSPDEKGKGRKFVSRFIEPGIVHYSEFGDVLITKETLDKFISTLIGCPVIIKHKDIDDSNVDKERAGVISDVWFNAEDGFYHCSGIIWDKQAIDLVKNQGWNVSCTYDFQSDFEKKIHNGKKIDMEFTGGEFLHLALVPDPRYERASIVMNSKEKAEEGEDKAMNVLNELTDFVKNIINNNKEKGVKEMVKNEDKRKLIDEVAGMMKSAGCDDEIIRTAIKKMEKIGYEKSEADNEDIEEEKKEEFKEEKELVDNKKAKNEEEKEEEKKEEYKEEEKKEVKNSMDLVNKAVNRAVDAQECAYTSQAHRLELGNKF